MKFIGTHVPNNSYCVEKQAERAAAAPQREIQDAPGEPNLCTLHSSIQPSGPSIMNIDSHTHTYKINVM